MAKKKINIILILIVLGLWGTVVYKASHHSFNNGIMPKKQIKDSDFILSQINKDTFKLDKTNRDPFLNKSLQGDPIPSKKQSSNYSSMPKKIPDAIPKVKQNSNWPTLLYYGCIKSKNQELILLKIDSKLFRLKLNDPINGLVIKKKYKDSVEVRFNSETRIVSLKK
ncbi:hypothetical protein OA88_13275 [Flavobacterium sp. JRM]|nr:hypothetical protein OA88_13275 [Flavobacterium sp. JRM]